MNDISPGPRCHTRALKNARHLHAAAPTLFPVDADADGFGTGLPLEMLRNLHRLAPDAHALRHHPAVAATLRLHPLPAPNGTVSGSLLSGTIYFAQISFVTPAATHAIAADDLATVLSYARRAIIPIRKYVQQYGELNVAISPTVLAKTVRLHSARYTDSDLQRWVNELADESSLSADSCIFVVSPHGVSAHNISANAGYHSKAHIPYIVAGIHATGLTITDRADTYAMAVSHEIAETIVDPDLLVTNPEVCDPCDLNCGNLTRCYFTTAGSYLGSNRRSPPGGFQYAFYTCAVVRPAGAADCPASAANCAYRPSEPRSTAARRGIGAPRRAKGMNRRLDF